MDKYEFNIKIDQIKKRADEGDYRTAMKIADSIDWSRVRNINLLTLASSVYEKNGEYDEAKDKLLQAFERAPVGKRLLYKLCEISVRSGDLEEARDYYNEFVDIAPDDAGAHVLAYLILRGSGAPYDRQISELSQYTASEPDERWLYELAKVYDEAGYGRECVSICDRIALLFGAGRYSDKAMQLKAKYEKLTEAQQELINDEPRMAVEQMSPEEAGDELAAIRYENEDEAFEEYLKAHDLDKPLVREEAAAEPNAGQKEAVAVSETPAPQEAAVSKAGPDYSEGLSAEVNRLSSSQMIEDHASKEEKTIIFDSQRMEELRRLIIKGGRAEDRSSLDLIKKPEVNISVESVKPVPAPELTKEVIAPVVEALGKAALGREVQTAKAVSDTVASSVNSVMEGQGAVTAAQPKDRVVAEAAQEKPAAKSPKEQTVPQAEASEEPAAKPQGQTSREAKPVQKKAVKKHHMIIEAEDAESGFEIAKDELKNIHKEYGLSNTALKTSAKKLNERGLSEAVIEKLRGKDFIVESAGDLSPKLLDSIYRLIREDESGMIVVLIDVPEGLDRIEARKPEIFGLCDLVSDFDEEYEDQDAGDEDGLDEGYEYDADGYEDEDHPEDEDEPYDESRGYDDSDAYDDSDDYDDAGDDSYDEDYDDDPYEDDDDDPDVLEERPVRRGNKRANAPELHNNIRIEPPKDSDEEMELDDFAQYCCQYASEIDCSITGKSMLALYERIELMEEDSIPLTKRNAVRLIEEAADRAEKPPIGKRLKGMFSSKYDKNGLLILKEEDFIY